MRARKPMIRQTNSLQPKPAGLKSVISSVKRSIAKTTGSTASRLSSLKAKKTKPSAGRPSSLKRKPAKLSKPKSRTRPRIRQSNAFELEVFRLVNLERTSRGIAALTLNARLAELARLKSEDMRDNNYFSHTSPTYGTPLEMLKRFGVAHRAYAENIAAGQPTPAAVVNTWMNSPGHRANILDPRFTDTGVGYVGGTPTSRYQHYWTQLFIQKP